MRALITATVPSMIGQFNMKNIDLLIKLGYEVDVACNFNDKTAWPDEKIIKLKNDLKEKNVSLYQLDFERSIFNFRNNFKSYRQVKNLINVRKYDIIHTHTPISSLITRIAFKNSKIYSKCKLLYTAHGFHFYDGNNNLKNIIFKNIEKYAARFTDIIITINKEDYYAAKKFKLRDNGDVKYVPGVGIDIDRINSFHEMRNNLLDELDISKNSILLLSVGELNNNKNHKMIIESLPSLSDNIHYLVCGEGPLRDKYIKISNELNVGNRFHLLGYRNDVLEIMKSCDIFVLPSKREGLSVALMEAMACGMPCIVSAIRGNRDLIEDHINGYLINPNNCYNLRDIIDMIIQRHDTISFNNIDKSKDYSDCTISDLILKIYMGVTKHD